MILQSYEQYSLRSGKGKIICTIGPNPHFLLLCILDAQLFTIVQAAQHILLVPEKPLM